MRRILLIIAVLTLSSAALSAQIVPGLEYSDLKYIYNPKEYKSMQGDPYSPFLSAVGSFFIPGLGQFCCGERGRGLGMFAAGVAIDGAFFFCGRQFVYYLNKNSNGLIDLEGELFTDFDEAAKWAGSAFTLGGIALVYGIFCSIDAVSVAKVRNMYWRDLQKLGSVQFEMHPTLGFAPENNNATPVAGMALSVKF